MKLSRFLIFGAVVLLGVALAQSIKQISVQLSGKTIKLESVVVQGKTYVSLEQLKKALPTTTAGGAVQVQAASGCLNEQLFNGAWRFRVAKLEYSAAEAGWVVTVELKNGMNRVAYAYNNGANGLAEDLFLILENGNTVQLASGAANEVQDSLILKNLAPGAGTTAKLFFGADADTPKATKFLWAMSAENNNNKAPLSKDPAFRVDLTCKK
jgi:hypothetical protein